MTVITITREARCEDCKYLGVNNWGNPVHECEHCGYIILESEFEYLK